MYADQYLEFACWQQALPGYEILLLGCNVYVIVLKIKFGLIKLQKDDNERLCRIQ